MKLDAAVMLIFATALISMSVDVVSRRLRRALRIDSISTRLSAAPVKPR